MRTFHTVPLPGLAVQLIRKLTPAAIVSALHGRALVVGAPCIVRVIESVATRFANVMPDEFALAVLLRVVAPFRLIAPVPVENVTAPVCANASVVLIVLGVTEKSDVPARWRSMKRPVYAVAPFTTTPLPVGTPVAVDRST